ncbi:hypothetical protein [Asaia prunellae]|uniref:hypothetical protein n=1 Tax=Asaia prunellae TaxID=610245 RepID=UPI000470D299|nr:hypothetical protein [Asaia prunellae]
MRVLLAIGLLASLASPAALAASDGPSSQRSAARNSCFTAQGLKSNSSYSLEPVTTEEPLIRQASLTVRAPAAASKDGFTQAPLPDDEVEAPRMPNTDRDTSLKADFFQRNHHQVGDALAGGAAVNDQRRGHGSMAAGLAVAIPLD